MNIVDVRRSLELICSKEMRYAGMGQDEQRFEIILQLCQQAKPRPELITQVTHRITYVRHHFIATLQIVEVLGSCPFPRPLIRIVHRLVEPSTPARDVFDILHQYKGLVRSHPAYLPAVVQSLFSMGLCGIVSTLIHWSWC